MNKRYPLLYALLSLSLVSFSQMYILNEDFSGTSGATPPAGWENVVISGVAEDEWHFDNPGQRIVNYPVLEPFAIFDAEAVSANGQAEEVALETPLFDASVSNYILLHFHQAFEPGPGGEARVEAFDGEAWLEVAVFTSATSNPSAEVVDLSAVIGGATNARLRFTWSGNSSGFWAIDNIRIYAAQPLDGGVVSIDSPTSPVTPGVQNVVITLGNFGYNTITSTTVNWTVNGIPQTPYPWSGSLGFGQTLGNVVIGSYDFQSPVDLTVWQSNPNGGNDPNPYNDTISKRVESALCGSYTIGGPDGDFESFSEVATTLNLAGITCPVTFLVREGLYYDQFILGDIPGSSATNTITFESESGNNTETVLKISPGALKFEPMIYLDGTHHIIFRNLGLFTGSSVSFANTAVQLNNAHQVLLEGCHFEVRNYFDYGVDIHGGSSQVSVEGSRFESISGGASAIIVSEEQTRNIQFVGNDISGPLDWGYNAVQLDPGAGSILLEDNVIEDCFRAIWVKGTDSVRILHNRINEANEGISVEEGATLTEISGNRLTGISSHPNYPDGTNAILLFNSDNSMIFNNFIHTKGEGATMGIKLVNAADCGVYYNSLNITNTDQQDASAGLLVQGSSSLSVQNNILAVLNTGRPVSIDALSDDLIFDRNDYYMLDGTIGYYAGVKYTDLGTWRTETGLDMTSLSVPPFFTSLTDLSINQALLNNTALPVPGIEEDIDGVLRDPLTPDLGAKEYSPCATDAGINRFTAPVNPLTGGPQNVTVSLQNQGTSTLSSAQIQWSVNGQLQTAFPWTGSLGPAENAAVTIGSFDFQPGILYTLRAWTVNPNGTDDCNALNDSIQSPQLAVPLCGTYTVGGTNPHFASFEEVSFVLNVAGVSCPVTFLIRDGTYQEKITLKDIPGSSDVNTVTIRSESGDSTKVFLQIPPTALKNETVVFMEGTRHVAFLQMGFLTGATIGFTNTVFLMTGTENIRFENCYFELRKESDLAFDIKGGSQEISMMGNHIRCTHARALALKASEEGTGNISVVGNQITGATAFNANTIRIEKKVSNVLIEGNYLEQCFKAISLANSSNIQVKDNVFFNVNYGVYTIDLCSFIGISGNRFREIRNNPDTQEGTSAVLLQNTSQSTVFNNYIHGTGNGPVKAISLQSTTSCGVYFNSVNITNEDPQGKSRAIYLKDNQQAVVRNNVFNISRIGIPVHLEGSNNLLDMDRNDLYSYDGSIGWWNGTRYTRLDDWRAATAFDANSVSAPPFFTSDTDLAINQVLLNNAGLPVAGITTDIAGAVRDPQNPDLGAKEYTPCPVDAGINVVVSPQSPIPGGPEDVSVQLQNHGASSLTSVTIHWSVAEVSQTAYEWTGNLAPGENTVVTIGSFNFLIGKVYMIHAWTSQPNGNTDCNPQNDTVAGKEITSPLCGIYTIGGVEPDFLSLTQAANVLNQSGIACPVTFLVRDGTYYEQFVLESIPGSSRENTIVFISESRDNSAVQVRISPDALKYEAIIRLKNTQYISFESMGFYTGSQISDANSALRLEGAEHITLHDCYVEAKKDNDFGLIVDEGSRQITISDNHFECIHTRSGAIDMADEQTSVITVSGNRIKGPASWSSTILRIGSGVSRVDLDHNQIEQCYRAIYAVGADSLQVRNNVIRNVNDGIYIDYQCSNVEITANRIIHATSHQNSPEGTSGILAQNSLRVGVVNNFVHTTGAGPSKGITLIDLDSCRVYFNTVHVTNTDAQGKSRGIYLQGIGRARGRDNILSVKALGAPMEIGLAVPDISLDYNNYYQSSGIVGILEGITYTNLAQWGQTLNGDANSKVVNPFFKADTIPLPFQRQLNGAGILIPGILFDIDGKLRYAQAPDMGCLEFFVDYGVLDLLSPSLNCFHPEVDTVIIHIRQFGDVPFNDLKVAYQMNGGPIHQDTIPGPHYEDVIHSFGTTENLTTYGEYLFKIWLINTLDDNINNDTLYAWRYSKPSPVPTFSYDNFCTGPKVYFTGTATVPEPYFIDGYEWLFGDGATSVEQNPVHTYAEPGTYQVAFRAYSDAGCYGEIILPVYINPEFVPLTLDYNITDETCLFDGTGSIEILLSGGFQPVNITFNGQPVTNLFIQNLTTGQYIIEAVDSENCRLTDTVYITSTVFMNPHITAEPLTGNSPLTVNFSFTAEKAKSWLWHFSETETDTSLSPSFTFLDYGSHTVRLEVMSGPPYYCTETALIEIFVDVIISIEANNVFTPNGDGVNDYFEIITTGIRQIEANIFNLWGGRVYRIEDLNGKWDGNTAGGAKAPDGTYFWSLQATGADNKIYERQGSVLLLRHAAEAFPNPVADKVRIKVHDILTPPVEIKIFSAHGQLVRQEFVQDNENLVIDVSGLPGGIYFIKISAGTANYFVRIIKH